MGRLGTRTHDLVIAVLMLGLVLSCAPVKETPAVTGEVAVDVTNTPLPSAEPSPTAGSNMSIHPDVLTARDDFLYLRWCETGLDIQDPLLLCSPASISNVPNRPPDVYFSADGLVFLEPHGSIEIQWLIVDPAGTVWGGYDSHLVIAACSPQHIYADLQNSINQNWSRCDATKEIHDPGGTKSPEEPPQ